MMDAPSTNINRLETSVIRKDMVLEKMVGGSGFAAPSGFHCSENRKIMKDVETRIRGWVFFNDSEVYVMAYEA